MDCQQDIHSVIQHVEVRKGKFVFRYSIRKPVKQTITKPDDADTNGDGMGGSVSTPSTYGNTLSGKLNNLNQNWVKSKKVKDTITKETVIGRNLSSKVVVGRNDEERKNVEKNPLIQNAKELSDEKGPNGKIKSVGNQCVVHKGENSKNSKTEKSQINRNYHLQRKDTSNQQIIHVCKSDAVENSKARQSGNSRKEQLNNTVLHVHDSKESVTATVTEKSKDISNNISGCINFKGEDEYVDEIIIATIIDEDMEECNHNSNTDYLQMENHSKIERLCDVQMENMCSDTQIDMLNDSAGNKNTFGQKNSLDVKKITLPSIADRITTHNMYSSQIVSESVVHDNTISRYYAKDGGPKDEINEDLIDDDDDDDDDEYDDNILRNDSGIDDGDKMRNEKDSTDGNRHDQNFDSCINIHDHVDRDHENFDTDDDDDDDDKTVIYGYDEEDDLSDEKAKMDKEILQNDSITVTIQKHAESMGRHTTLPEEKKTLRNSHFTVKKLKTGKAKIKKKQKLLSSDLQKCNLCDRRYHQDYLQMHIARVHHGIKPHKCHLCDWTFATISHLNRHLNSHAKNPNFPHRRKKSLTFTCDICFKNFTEYRYMKRHMAKHTGFRMHKCEICGKSYLYKAGLTRHMQLHKDGPQISCGICNQKFYDSYALNKHLRDHVASQNAFEYKCGLCSIYFKKMGTLKTHMTLKHPDAKPHGIFKRDVLNIQLPLASMELEKTQTELEKTQTELEKTPTVEAQKGRSQCRTCCREFSQKSQLLTHLTRSHGAKKKKLKRSDIDIDAYLSGTTDL